MVILIFISAIIIGVVAFYFYSKLTKAEVNLEAAKKVEIELQRKLQTLQTELQLSTQDAVTGLPTWLLFEDRLNQVIKESERYQLHLAVLYIDIDDFSMINNAFGYEIGNQVLREVAGRLQSCIRQVDSISRFSKDTFVIFLTQLSKPETAAVVAQRIMQAFAEPIQVSTHEMNVTLCLGISIYPQDGANADDLLSNAEHAMRLARKLGRNVFQFFQPQLSIESKREMLLYNLFGRENFYNELVIYYQPVIDVRDESILCIDALLHWQPHESDLINPNELEKLAERRHKSNKMSEWLFEKACRQFLHWRTMGFSPNLLGISLFVNQLHDTHFIYRLSQIMQECDFKPEWMMLRVKETGKQASFDVIEKAFNMLSYMGIQLAIDNVGTNNFSFRYLKNFSIRFLKLDSAITNDIETNPKTVLLIKSILSFAETLSVQAIIQEVESANQFEALKEAGCTLMQGSHFGALLTEKDVAAMAAP